MKVRAIPWTDFLNHDINLYRWSCAYHSSLKAKVYVDDFKCGSSIVLELFEHVFKISKKKTCIGEQKHFCGNINWNFCIKNEKKCLWYTSFTVAFKPINSVCINSNEKLKLFLIKNILNSALLFKRLNGHSHNFGQYFFHFLMFSKLKYYISNS